MNVRNRITTQTMLPPRVSIEIGIIVSCGMIVLLFNPFRISQGKK